MDSKPIYYVPVHRVILKSLMGAFSLLFAFGIRDTVQQLVEWQIESSKNRSKPLLGIGDESDADLKGRKQRVISSAVLMLIFFLLTVTMAFYLPDHVA